MTEKGLKKASSASKKGGIVPAAAPNPESPNPDPAWDETASVPIPNRRKKTRSPNEQNRLKGIMLIALIGAALTGTILLFSSFETLDVNEYGLKQNVFTKEIIGEPSRGGGWHYVGLEYDYIRFPATWQTVDFTPSASADDRPINTQTRDGLAITFDASFQYRLNMSSLRDTYSSFGVEYNKQIVEVSRGSLRNVAAIYSATEFLQNRTLVGDSMRVAIVSDLASMDIEIEFFQLRAITLPSAFMHETEQVEVARLQQQIATYELAAAQIAAQQTILEAEVAANVSLIQAYAAANVTLTEAIAQAEALNITRSMEALTLADLMNATGMNTTTVIAFLYVQALENLPPGTTLVLGDFVSLLIGT